ncbi:MAG TPA: hypothetical protein PLU87_12070 [Sedimentisphaerales bacterium]|nr:hypothetical protein [Sedimentisphaerales bacterium]HRS11774.1 hypothetical protein [Sedimentisphaerales bacterium]HRV48435.1 hypothetical protein [Sedimentisphaerales bacterium]
MSRREAAVPKCGWSTIPEGVIDAGFLSDAELAVLVELTQHRRSLPVYHGWCWCCYECGFVSTDLTSMGRHILRAHQPAVDELKAHRPETGGSARHAQEGEPSSHPGV